MPRTYKKLLGSRAYKNYTDLKMEEALQKIVDGSMSIRGASAFYNIPFGTLYNKFKGKHVRKPGAQPVFNHGEEISFLKSAAKCSEWGFPLNLLDLRMLAKGYLDKKGRIVAKFKNNIPGVDWAYSLLNRHDNEYSQRIATNIKRARASVSKETLTVYFNNLANTLKDVPPTNIFNYDESNMSDDTGKRRGIYRRGVKYPEKVTNFSKSSTSVMVCGSADGVLLPPYVIYKSTHLYDTWKERGPCGPPCCDKACCSQGTRYNRTVSGWIDAVTFRDWFLTCFLPHAKRLQGRKVLIGDNLSAHIDDDVLQICSENKIDFVCLVPNSTHLTQPLDVAFFRPMKEAWRAVLTTWKLENQRMTTVPKDTFPYLLNKALKKMDDTKPKKGKEGSLSQSLQSSAIKRNLISGFRATGIFPLNKDEVFKRLPSEEECPEAEIESVLTKFLKEKRFGDSDRPIRRKKRLDIPAGMSAATFYSQNEENIDEGDSYDEDAGTSTIREDETENVVNIDQLESSVTEEKEEDMGISVDQFVLAKFCSVRGKKTYKYVCRITETSPAIMIVGYHSVEGKRKYKLVSEDVADIEPDDIVAFLPTPLFKKNKENKEYVEFPFDVNICEMK